MSIQVCRFRFILPLLLVLAAGLTHGADGEKSGNLIPNGDFSKGNTGFKCDLPYIKPDYNCLWEGKYTIATIFNKPLLHRLIAPEPFNVPGKPLGKVNVMFANAGGTDPLDMYETDVKVQPHTKYEISFYCMSMTGYIEDGNPPHQVATWEWVPEFEIWANGLPSAPIQAGKGEYAKGSLLWDSKDETTANIKIIRTKFPHGGGIIALCDVEMVPVKE